MNSLHVAFEERMHKLLGDEYDSFINEIVGIGQNSRGLKTKLGSDGRDYFGWIRNTIAPAVLVECAFVDNKNDIKILDTEAEQKAMGVAIAKGILKTLGIQYSAEQKAEPPKAEDTKLYRVQVGAFANKANAEKLKAELEGKGYSAIIV